MKIRSRARRFFCQNQDCPRKIFAEPLTGFTWRHQRQTQRAFATQRQLALTLGGEAGARLALFLGLPTSGDTLLRRLKILDNPAPGKLRVIGIDDWALRRGQTYGTLICDLERKCPVALLPNRDAETVGEWLKTYPGIEIISRDRAGEYARAATLGAPQAIQVADRWHLLRNVQEALRKAIEPQSPAINNALQATTDNEKNDGPNVNTTSDSDDHHSVVEPAEPQSNHNPARRQRFEKVVQLHQEGKSQRCISKITGLSRKTVRRFLQCEQYPERAAPNRASRITRFADTIHELVQQGVVTGTQIYAKLKESGFDGSYYMVLRYLNRMKREASFSTLAKPVIRNVLWSVRRIAWLLVREAGELSETEQKQVRIIEAACPDVKSAATIAREFSTMVRNQDATAWAPRISKATAPQAPAAMRRFASNLRSDLNAVKAALALPWSNGQLEGQVNRLKTIKRQMYGRANLKLLECRMLHPA